MATDAAPIWSPDGQRIVFRSNRGGLHDLYQKAANGAGQHTLLYASRNAKHPTDWMPDGRGVIYHADQRGTGSDIWLVFAGGARTTPLVQTAFDEMQGQVSPDGKWLAYTSRVGRRRSVCPQPVRHDHAMAGVSLGRHRSEMARRRAGVVLSLRDRMADRR